MELLLEFWNFLKSRKKYWLWPTIILLVLLGLLLAAAQSTALAPFIYSLF